jgi:hypothetical protein
MNIEKNIVINNWILKVFHLNHYGLRQGKAFPVISHPITVEEMLRNPSNSGSLRNIA